MDVGGFPKHVGRTLAQALVLLRAIVGVAGSGPLSEQDPLLDAGTAFGYSAPMVIAPAALVVAALSLAAAAASLPQSARLIATGTAVAAAIIWLAARLIPRDKPTEGD